MFLHKKQDIRSSAQNTINPNTALQGNITQQNPNGVKPKINIFVAVALFTFPLIILPVGAMIGGLFIVILFAILTNYIIDDAIVPFSNALAIFCILFALYASFSPFMIYIGPRIFRKWFTVYKILGILTFSVPPLAFFFFFLTYGIKPSNIQIPSKFYIHENSLYIYDLNEIYNEDKVVNIIRPTSKPDLIWVYDIKSGMLKNKLDVTGAEATNIMGDLKGPEAVAPPSAPMKKNCSNYTFRVEQKPKDGKNEVSIYKGLTYFVTTTIDTELTGRHDIFMFEDDFYIKIIDEKSLTIIKVNGNTGEQKIIINENSAPKQGWYCYINKHNNNIIELNSGNINIYYDVKAEKLLQKFDPGPNARGKVYYNYKYKFPIVYNNEGLLVYTLPDVASPKKYKGDFTNLFEYSDDFLIFYTDKRGQANPVNLLNAKSLELITFAGDN